MGLRQVLAAKDLTMWLRLSLVLALVACSDTPAGKPPRTPQDRQVAAEAALSKTPVPRSYRLDGNELKVIDVPIKDSQGFLDSMRCFIWRDVEFKTATMSCGAQPEVLLGN
jgi:hypothetical protein